MRSTSPVTLVSGFLVFACRAPAAHPVQAPAAASRPPTSAIANAPPPALPPAAATSGVDCYRWADPIQRWEINLGPDSGAATAPAEVLRENEGHPEWAIAACEALKKRARPGTLVQCFQAVATRSTALWAMATTSPQVEGDSLYWQLLYSDAATKKTLKDGPWRAGDGGDGAVPGNDAPTIPTVIQIADLDGDGVEELTLANGSWSDAGNNWSSRIAIRSVSRGKIIDFPATQDLSLIFARDLDGDGRLEYALDPYGFTIGSDAGWMRGKLGWSILIELDRQGHVVDDGEKSLAFARELCPSPGGLLAELEALDDEKCFANYVHCANLWQLPVADVTAALERHCAPRLAAEGYTGLCKDSLSTWKQMLGVTLPLQLRKQP